MVFLSLRCVRFVLDQTLYLFPFSIPGFACHGFCGRGVSGWGKGLGCGAGATGGMNYVVSFFWTHPRASLFSVLFSSATFLNSALRVLFGRASAFMYPYLTFLFSSSAPEIGPLPIMFRFFFFSFITTPFFSPFFFHVLRARGGKEFNSGGIALNNPERGVSAGIQQGLIRDHLGDRIK